MCLAFLVPGPALAETWSTAGLSFSDELGGARLLSASGTGTRDDPIVLIEEIVGAGPAVLVVRNDHDCLRRYVHIGTGNYHAGTARLYTDLGLITCEEEIGQDLTELFLTKLILKQNQN